MDGQVKFFQVYLADRKEPRYLVGLPRIRCELKSNEEEVKMEEGMMMIEEMEWEQEKEEKKMIMASQV